MCREEFLDEITTCTDCKEPLVDEQEFVSRKLLEESATQDDLAQQEMIVFVEGSLAQCREFDKALTRAKISSVVYPLSVKDKNAKNSIGVFGDLNYGDHKYLLLIKEGDVERAKAAMALAFHNDVIKEGQGDIAQNEVCLDNEEITCPACKEIGPLDDGACRACGLHLDVQQA
jgi:hypothetical protein